MFIFRLIRFLYGYVVFEGIGGFPERFLNLCAREGCGVWNVRYANGVMTAQVTAGNYRFLRSCARRSGVRLKVKKRIGGAFLIYRYRRRTGILAGAAAFVLILAVCSNFVWTIRIDGNHTTDSAVIMQTMEELGLKVGVKRTGMDISTMQLEALRRLDELSWISVNIRGSIATVEVRERTMPPEMLSEETPCNIVAGSDGYIVRIEPYEGFAAVRVGESVRKGDLLVSGVIESKLQTTRFIHAQAKVTAATVRTVEAKVSYSQEKVIYPGETKKKYSVEFFGINIPLYFSQKPDWECEEEQTENRLKILGLNLPFALKTTKYVKTEKSVSSITQEEAYKPAREEIEKKKVCLKV